MKKVILNLDSLTKGFPPVKLSDVLPKEEVCLKYEEKTGENIDKCNPCDAYKNGILVELLQDYGLERISDELQLHYFSNYIEIVCIPDSVVKYGIILDGSFGEIVIIEVEKGKYSPILTYEIKDISNDRLEKCISDNVMHEYQCIDWFFNKTKQILTLLMESKRNPNFLNYDLIKKISSHV